MSERDQHLPGLHQRTLICDERERSYLVYIPQSDQPNSGWPVVLALHGSGSHAADMLEFCQLTTTAEQEGFIVVFPNGSGRVPTARTWNSGRCCGHAHRHKIDDVRFFNQLLDSLTNQYPIDSLQVYATGMSNGAMMCYRLANELAHRIAAIAAVAGTMDSETCSPCRPVPLLHIHGTDDQFVKYNGGYGPLSISRGDFYSVEHTMQQWVYANHAEQSPQTSIVSPIEDDGTSVEKSLYQQQGIDSAEVVLYTVHNGGHTWPGQKNKYPFLGKVSQNLDANQVIWEFFKRNPMQEKSESH